MIALRLLTFDESDAAARLHRRAGALIPDYDTSLHSEGEFLAFYRDKVMVQGPIWGAFDDGVLRGHLALLPGWIDHLYVEPAFHGRGVGGALVRLAQREQDELRLHTFQSNIRARALYERYGFRIEELTNGQRNEEKMPDVTYHWRRSETEETG
uniref:GCN5-related N-acetyltransferase n=1 Tax=Caulobacter sp. (strain K31) TaxID=366602 RepID=B0SVB5_CAUSK